MTKLISSWQAVLALYAISFAFLVVGAVTSAIWPLITALVIFTIWDVLWIYANDDDRNAQEMLDTSTRARTYMSYYIAIYGAAIVFILPLSAQTEREAALQLLADSGVPGWLLIAPLVLCSVAMLFFPIKLGAGTGTPLEKRKPTPANVTIVIFNAYIQKVATYIFVYAILLIVAPVWQANKPAAQTTTAVQTQTTETH